MTLRLVTAACAALCLVAGSAAVQADVVRASDEGSFKLANVAPPEPEQPAAAPSAPPTEGAAPAAEGTPPAETPTTDPAAAPVDPAAAPTDSVPEVPAAEATPETTATDATASDAAPAEGGSTPWLWIVIGAIVVGGLGFFLWRRSAG